MGEQLTVAVVGSADFSYGDALVALLTVETLAFAALAVTVSFTIPSNRIPNLPVSLPALGRMAVGFVALIAFGGFVSWLGLFHEGWPHGFYNGVISGVLAISILAQPVFAWIISRGLQPKS